MVALGLSAGALWAAETFTAGMFQATLSGEAADAIEAVEGGDAVGVVTIDAGPADIPNKHLAREFVVEPISLRFQPSAAGLVRWASEGLPPMRALRTGAIRGASVDGIVLAERTFKDAIVTRVDFPGLDVASLEGDSLRMIVQPVSTTYSLVEDGSTLKTVKTPKRITRAAFRLTIDQLDTSGVATIAPLSILQPIQPLAGGGFHATGYQVSNLVVSLSAAKSESWFAWFDDFVVKGNSTDSSERTGKVEYLSADLKSVIGTVELRGLGIVSIGAERADGWVTRKGAKSASGRVVAELYVESATLKP